MGATVTRWAYPGGPYTCDLCEQVCAAEIQERVPEEGGGLICHVCYDMLSALRKRWCENGGEDINKLTSRAEQKLRDAYFKKKHPVENWEQHLDPINKAKVKWGLS